MSLQKQTLSLPFAEGLDTKTNPWLVQPGKMLSLENAVFAKGGLLQKRNGFQKLSDLPDGANATTLTTFNGNLTAIGDHLYAYNREGNEWIDRGVVKPIQLSVQTAVRTSYTNSAPDAAVMSNGLSCSVFLDGDDIYKYQINDNTTGQVLVSANDIDSGTAATKARVFVLGKYFIITYLITVAATPRLKYIAIQAGNLDTPSSPVEVSNQVSSLTAGYDGYVINNNLYLAWDGSDGGGAFRVTRINSALVQFATVTVAGVTATTSMSVTADATNSTPIIYVTGLSTPDAYTVAFNQNLLQLFSPVLSLSVQPHVNVISTAQNNVLSLFAQISNTYGYNVVRSDEIQITTVSSTGTILSGPTPIAKGLGLASKAFIQNGLSYFMGVFGEDFQPTYFLLDQDGNVIAKLAYSNAGPYAVTQVLPSVSLNDNLAQIAYLYKTQISPVNKMQGAPSSASVYSQTGINIVTIDFSKENLITAEIGNSLYIAGGFLWQYDGVKPVETGFHLWPENVLVTTSGAGGSLSAQTYFYQVTYEWTDGQGLVHRSAPSIPFEITTVGATSSNTLKIPTLRLTYKTAPNNCRIVIYRWSTAQQVYYQITSITNPLLNDPSVDGVTYVDTLADSSIVGNAILYTNGGVVENIAPPACSAIALYRSRLMLIDAEDRNLLWFSKQVIEGTPVEMSDLFTIFVSPTTGSNASTGPSTALSAMDDKLIIFKSHAMYYLTGVGPDNTGANNDFSEPIFISSTIGTENQQSIVFIPSGLLFDSAENNRWALGRDLSTSYLGAPAEAFNGSPTVNTVVVSDQNQARLGMSNGLTLMYDYFYNQWGVFKGVPNISSCNYLGEHTYLNQYGEVYQELPNTYQDGSNPVLMAFTTAWMSLSGLQGFERAYFFNILGRFLSPHKLQISMAYDFNDSPENSVLITPDNFAPTYGEENYYGQGPSYGGNGDIEQWRIFFKRQKCQSFSITVQEVFNNQYGTIPGAGATFTGLNITVGTKAQYPKLKASRSIG